MVYVLVMDTSGLFELYLDLAPAELFRSLQRELQCKRHGGIYSARLVLWMMIDQRLQARGTLASSVLGLVQGRFDRLLSRCKRVESGHIATSTGGYCQARQRLPKLLVSRTMQELIEALRRRLLEADEQLPQRAYVLDGSSLQLEHEPELAQAFPPGSGGRGISHWPLLRVVVLHDLETGLAERPWWGPLNGPQAVSEQALAEHALQQLPAGRVIVADRNFGIFSIAWSAQQSGHDVVVRLTKVRAHALHGGPISGPCDVELCWRASRWDGKHKGKDRRSWPADASVSGRLIACRVGRGKQQQWLYLFTTLAQPAEAIVALYGRRWTIETDLRSLKQTVRLQRIAVHSEQMLDKELLVAVMAYNLVRALMALAARQAGISPRELSFTNACHAVLEGYPKVLAARTAKRQQIELQRLVELVSRCRLPRRSKHRAYPREIWSQGYHFPFRHAEKTK